MDSLASKQQYAIFHDTTDTGKATTFFRYSAEEMNFLGVDIVRKCMKETTREEIIEGLRRQLVSSMRSGSTMIIDVGKISPDFSDIDQYNTLDETIWPSDTIFDQSEWSIKSNYMKIVRKEEAHRLGSTIEGTFDMRPGFNLLILSSGTEETLSELE